MTDVASIGVKFDTAGVEKGIRALEQVAQAGPRVERSMSGVERAADKTTKVLRSLSDGAGRGLDGLSQSAPKAEAGINRVAQSAERAKQSISEMVRAGSTIGSVLQSANTGRGFSVIEAGATSAASAVGRLNTVLALAGAGVSVQSIIAWADGYTKFTAQLRNATDSASEYAFAMDSVKRISTDAQAGMNELGVLYARIATSTKELGISQTQVAKITETVAMSLKANGASASEASSAMLQLSQAFGSGVLRGEEFNAVYEAAPNLLRNLADAMGVPQGKLREMASEGKLTADVLAKYLPESLEKVRKEAESMATIGGSFTVLNNKIMEFVGAGSDASGAAKAISGSVVGLANNLDTVATAAGAVALVMTGRYLAAMTASTAASTSAALAATAQQVAYVRAAAAISGASATATAGMAAMTVAARGASAAMAFLGGPVGLVIAGLGLAATAMYSFGDSAKSAGADIGGLDQPLDNLLAKLSALPPEKRVAVIIDFDEQRQQAIVSADEAIDALIQSVGDLTNMRLPTGEWNDLRDRVEAASKSGQDLTPILQAAAKSANLPAEHLNKWMQLAGNLRVAQGEAAELKRKLDDISGRSSAGGGRGGSYHPLSLGVGETASEFDKRTGAALNAQVKAALDASKGYKSLSERMSEVRKEGGGVSVALKALEQAGRGTSKEADQLRDRLKGVDEKLKSMAKSGQSGAAGLKQQENAYKTLSGRIQDYIAQLKLEAEQGGKVTTAQKLQIDLDNLLIKSKGKVTAAKLAQSQADIAIARAMEEADIASKREADQADEAAKAYESVLDATLKRVDSVRDQIEAEKDAAAAIGLSALELAQLEAAKLNDLAASRERQAALMDDIDLSGTQSAALRAEAQAYRDLAAAKGQRAVAQANKDTADQAAKDWERVSQTIGDTLADYIMGGGKDAATYLKRLFSTLVLQPVVQTAVGSLLGQPASGGLSSALGGGQGGIAGMANNAQSLYSAFNGGMAASLGSTITSLGSAFGSAAITSFGTGMMGITGAGAVTGATTGAGLGLSMGSSLGAGLGLQAGAATATTATSVGAGAAGAASAGSMAAAALPWVAGALAIYTLASSLFGKETPHAGAASQYVGGAISSGGKQYTRDAINADYLGDMQGTIDGLTLTLGSSLDAISKTFGGTGGYSVTAGFKSDDDDPSNGRLEISNAQGDTLVKWLAQRSGEYGSRKTGQSYASDPTEGYDDYMTAVTAATIPQFKEIVPAWADAMLDSFGRSIGFSGNGNDWKSITATGADSMQGLQAVLQQIAQVDAAFKSLGETMPMFAGLTDDMVSQLLGSVGGSTDALSSVISGFYSAFTSEAEQFEHLSQRLQNATGVDPRLGDEAAAQFKAAVEQAMAAGNGALAMELMALAPAFKQATDHAAKLTPVLETVSEIMRGLQDERAGLEAELLSAMGDSAGHSAAVRDIAIAGYEAAEVAAWDYNRALQSQISSAQAATAALGGLGATQWDLENQLLGLQGRGTEVEERTRTKELGELLDGVDDEEKRKQITASYDYNTSLRKQVEALNAAQQAANSAASAQQSAADAIRSSWQSIGDSIIDEINRIRGVVVADSGLGLDYYQAQFAITTAQAKAGDQSAAEMLPEVARSLLTMAEASATTLTELQRYRNQTAGSLEQTLQELSKSFGISVDLPRLDVGTNYVQRSGLAVIHEGEAVVPKAFNPWANGQGMGSNNAELVTEMRALREENRVQAGEIVRLNLRMTKVLEKWERDGMPEERGVIA